MTTWNPSDLLGITLSNGNLTAAFAGGGTFCQVRSTTSKASGSGKFHVEFSVDSDATPGDGNCVFGISSASHAFTTYIGSDLTSAGIEDAGGWYYNNGATQTNTTLKWHTGDLIAFEVDFTTSPPTMYAQNFTQSSGWISRVATNITGSPWFLSVELEKAGNQTTTNFGGSAFTVTPQAGFVGWDSGIPITSNDTYIGTPPIGEFAIGQFNLGLNFVPSLWAPFGEPVRQRIVPALAVALAASGSFQCPTPPQVAPPSTFVYQYSEPVRFKPSLITGAHPWLAYIGAATQNAPNNNFAEQSYYSKYAFPYSEPVRQKPGLPAWYHPAFTQDTILVPSLLPSGWFRLWQDPQKLAKQGLGAHLQQTTTQDTVLLPLTRMFPWYQPFSDPVRLKPGLGAPYQQFFATDAKWLTGLIVGWFNNLADPLRIKPGLLAGLQQFLAYHPRILPKPNITAVMLAAETNKDVASFAVNVYNSVTPTNNTVIANVSITEVPLIAGGEVAIEG